jgi:hypothetical protein
MYCSANVKCASSSLLPYTIYFAPRANIRMVSAKSSFREEIVLSRTFCVGTVALKEGNAY